MIIEERPLNVIKQYEDAMSSIAKIFIPLPWHDRRFYAMWLSQIYYFVCEATRLIPFAAAHFKKEDAQWHERCVRHSMEEMGHEEMAKNDIEKLGFNISDFAELPETVQFYQNQYYLIQNRDPIALFGINMYMEGLSINSAKLVTDNLVNLYGKEANTFMVEHCLQDQHHMEEVFKVIKACPTSRQGAIAKSLDLAQINFEGICKKVLALYLQKPESKSIRSELTGSL